jgi:Tfp pilus assembly protein PilF
MQNAFPRFDTINIVFEPKEERQRAIGGNKGIDYWLSGSIDVRDGQKVAHFQLRDNDSSELIWTGTFERTAAAPNLDPIERQIVDELATKLFQPFGVIRSHQRRLHLAGPAGDPRYRCIVATSESLRSFAAADHALARDCLEKLTAAHPEFDSGFAYLAAVYYREDQYGFAARPGDAPARDRALRAARRAIELKPEQARPYQMLATVLFGRREIAESFAASRKAMALNPSDMTIVSDFGGRLILTGDIERGMGMLRRAAEFGAVRPSWYHFYVFLGSYMSGDFAAAAFEADQITVAGYQLGYLARALSSASRGNGDRARAEIERLIALGPGWRTDPRGELARFIPNPDMVERLARDLAAAGLAGGG